MASDASDHFAIRKAALGNTDSVFRFNSINNANATFSIQASGIHRIEWYGAKITCDVQPCPDGGGRRATTVSPQPGTTISTIEDSYIELTPAGDATLTGSGDLQFALLAGPSIDLNLNGWMRLPLAHGHTDCATCTLPENQTLTATGNLTLTGMHVTGPGQMAGDFTGDVSTLRFDERAVSPALLGTASTVVVAVTAAAGVLGLATKLLAGLFTKVRGDPLEHPRRRRLNDYIVQHPGTSFREVVRMCEIAAGTARHHLNVLVRNGVVMEKRHRATTRFFENHGRYNDSWATVVLLREEPLGQLHAWLHANPGASQTEVLAGMQAAHGWSRSTTQHRLLRLVNGGAATMRLQGRFCLYFAGAPTQLATSLQGAPGIKAAA